MKAVCIAIFLISSCSAKALDYDVSYYHSDTYPDKDILEIVYDKCTTKFIVRHSEWKALDASDSSLSTMVDQAKEHAFTGCK